jgi:predicted N-acetyltransferase YhbS
MEVTIRSLDEADVPQADRIFRQAFGTFFGLPDPQTFTGDAALIATRWRADPQAALGAYGDGSLIGSSFAGCWGSFGFIGPVSVRPDLWGQRVAQQLMSETVALLEGRAARQLGLFTFPQSTKHIALYQKFGFWPQHLTPVMSKPVRPSEKRDAFTRYSAAPAAEQTAALAQCAALTDTIFPGLDLRPEIRSIAEQRLGETILIHDGAGLAGFACCHMGAGTEARSGAAFVKFGAVRPGPDAPKLFERLLDGCEAAAAEAGCPEIVAGTNTARHQAYRQMVDRGFRAFIQGVAMLRPNEPAFNRPDCFVIDDLR